MKTKVIICYSTNRNEIASEKFNKEIKATIGLKKDNFNIYTMQNNDGKSLTSVYNELWNLVLKYNDSKECVIVFCHHDIHFKSKNWGKTLLNIFNNNDVDIVGLAGTDILYKHGVWWLDSDGQFNKKDLWGKVWHTDGKKEWKSDFTTINKKCKKLQPVVAIDGLFITINPETCFKFDEDFTGFHYYDISFCIDNYIFGKKIAVTEIIDVCHESGGKLSEDWENNRSKFCEIYEKNLPLKIL